MVSFTGRMLLILVIYLAEKAQGRAKLSDLLLKQDL